jgi:DNA polymerase
LGYYATKYTFEKYAIQMPSKPDFHKVFGNVFLAEDRKILPLQHPAAVLYNDFIKEEMIKNYCKMKVLLTDCKWYPTCPMKRFYE